MQQFKRIFLLILDSVGVGEAPDAADFDDVGADTIGHIADYMDGLKMPSMKQLGLGNIRPIKGIEEVVKPSCFIRSEEHTSELQSRGHLVCRLLLEKKKKKTKENQIIYTYAKCQIH